MVCFKVALVKPNLVTNAVRAEISCVLQLCLCIEDVFLNLLADGEGMVKSCLMIREGGESMMLLDGGNETIKGFKRGYLGGS
jgi:hypothetical protein